MCSSARSAGVAALGSVGALVSLLLLNLFNTGFALVTLQAHLLNKLSGSVQAPGVIQGNLMFVDFQSKQNILHDGQVRK